MSGRNNPSRTRLAIPALSTSSSPSPSRLLHPPNIFVRPHHHRRLSSIITLSRLQSHGILSHPTSPASTHHSIFHSPFFTQHTHTHTRTRTKVHTQWMDAATARATRRAEADAGALEVLSPRRVVTAPAVPGSRTIHRKLGRSFRPAARVANCLGFLPWNRRCTWFLACSECLQRIL